MLKVGDIYPERAQCSAVDCARIVNKHGNLFQFLMYLQDPSNKEIEQVNNGTIKYGLFTQSLALFFIVHFDGIILDSPFNVYQMPTVHAPIDGNTQVSNIILIKSTSNQILAIRKLVLPNEMVDAISKGLKLQEQFLTENEIEAISHKVLVKHSPLDMLKSARVAAEA